MMKKKRKKLWLPLTGLVALLLAAAMLLMLPQTAMLAQALSLDHIEEIKQDKAASNSSFLIVEVAPSSEDGTIGYYVADQEPIAGWTKSAAAISGRENRENWVNGRFTDLANRNLLSSGDSTPLTGTGAYTEYYPWEEIPADALPLQLDSSESVTVTGSFSKSEGGSYEANTSYSLDVTGGTALQIISSFEYDTAARPGSYYYALDFTPIAAGTELADGTEVYRGSFTTKTETETADPVTEETIVPGDGSDIDTEPEVTESEPVTEVIDGVTTVTTVTTTVTRSFVPETTQEIFPELPDPEPEEPGEEGEDTQPAEPPDPVEPITVVTSVKVTTVTTVVTTKEITALHHGIFEGIVGQGLSLDLEEHYFTMALKEGSVPTAAPTEQNCYRAIGSGFADAPDGRGYFHADILDFYYVGSGRGSYSFTPDPAGSYSGSLSCSTVFYTGGYRNNNWFRTNTLDCTASETFPVVVRSYSPSEMAGHLGLLASADLIVLSSGLSGSGCSLGYSVRSAIEAAAEAGTPLMIDSSMTGALSSDLTSGIAGGGVRENIYVCNLGCIAGAGFRNGLDSDSYYSETAPLHPVYQEIVYENKLRAQQGVSPLPETVSEATCLRYIINYAGHRVENKKAALRVLDVEPMTSTAGLTRAEVRSWLPDGSFSDSQISITTMAAGELLGHIEDVSEHYDLIYIGDSSANVTKYLDTGFLYANIGKVYSVNSSLSGLPGGQNARFSGNDLNSTKYSQLLSYANAGYPIVLADSLVKEAQAPSTLSFTAAASGNVTSEWEGFLGFGGYEYYANLTASVSSGLPAGAAVSYQWYRGSQLINGATGASYRFRIDNAANNRDYHCDVRVSYQGETGTARTNSLHLAYASQRYNLTVNRSRNGNGNGNNPYNYSVSVTPGTAGLSFAWWDANNIGPLNSPDFWRDISTSASASSNRDYVRLQVTFPDGESRSYDFRKSDGNYPKTYSYDSAGYAFTDSGSSIAGSLPLAGVEGGINTTTVDTASYWYRLLDGIYGKDNVFSVTDAKNLKDKVLQSVNLSQPILTIYGDTQYSEASPAGTSLSDRTLYASFTIENPTDATPSSTRYNAYFYIDKNADGKFGSDELLYDTAFYNAGGSMVSSGSLKAGESYHIARRFASTYTGIIPWKLEVVKVGQPGAHASDIHYAYIKPAEPKTLRVLQICNGSDSVTDRSNGRGSVYRSSIFNSVPGVTVSDHETDDNRLKMAIKDDFILDLSILNVNMVNSYAGGRANGYVNDLTDELLADDPNPSLTKLLQSFDMLILGFGDTYGSFNTEAAQAVVSFIGTGKAILFCHDTTSFHNSDSSGWGYAFNQVDRDAVGLDRYGATRRGDSPSYTTAYVPGQSTQANNIQGFTSHTMERYRAGGGDRGNLITTTVTKVNSGQITTYPFTLGSTISTKETHDQYYQPNMSGDDMTVWYCLGGSNYSDIRNDVLNAYYIYNRGNVTYTGAGHENAFTVDEAKLFINTMIAAYRAAASAPEFSFRRSDDSADQGYLLLTQEQSVVTADGTEQTVTSIPTQKVYFKVIDTNIAGNLTISASFYYQNNGTAVSFTPEIFRADSGEEVSGSLSSYALYSFDLPEDLLEYLNSPASGGVVRLFGRATSSIGGTDYTSAPANMELRVVQQLNLS